MDTKHRVRFGSPQASKRQPRGPCAHVLLLNYYTRALEKPENRSQKRRLQVQPQIIVACHLERKVAGSNPREDFAFFVFNLAIMIDYHHQCAYSVLGEAHFIVMWQLTVT